MDVRCSVCGEDNPARARFCLACGSPIVPAADEAAGSIEFARESRRTLSVLFADVVGFTSLGERLDSESLRRVMDRFYAEMRGAVEAQGGTVAKFIGDAVMAVWGTPQVREDDALRAVRAADDMRAALASLNEDLDRRWGVRLGLRTGINTGELVVDPAQGADLLVGDALNVAARLEQAAADGDVLLGPDTARLVRHEADVEPVAPLELKGISRPMPAWRLRSARPGERPRSSRLQAPLVGREREVAHLRSAFYGAAAARETRLISVIGSPGVGKSRLVADFVAGIRHEARVLTARCEPTAQGATFLPLAGVLRAAAGIDERDGPEAAQAKLAGALPADDERELIAERAAGIVGAGPPVGVEETFWAVRRFLEGLAVAENQPVVLVVDDVQWAQPTLLDLHQHLARWGREAPVLVVVVARPELRELCPALATPGDVAMDVIELGPLGAQDSRTLVDRLLGAAELPAPLAERVVATTEGNPLFLSETLRMLVDEGVLRRDDGHWTVERGATAAGVTVPPTIQALLAARIERLASGERLAVERAAVIGQRFGALALADLLGPGARNGLDQCLEGLRRKELLAREQAPPAEGPVFRFQHALIRDAAYRSLLKEARADLHERHADWLASRPGEHDEAIGFHLERAHAYRHQLGPLDERGRALGRRGAERLHAAALRALAREDLRSAADLLTRALAALDGDDPERRTALLPDLAEALLSAGTTAAAERVVEELILRAEGDPRLEAWATVFACQLENLTAGGHVRENLGRVRQAAATLEEVGDPAGVAKAHHVAAVAYASLGQIASAEVALDRALVAAREAGDGRRVTAVLSGAPQAAVLGPSPIVPASGRCLDVVRILRMTPGNRPVEAAALRCQAVLEAMRGRFAAARRIIEACRGMLAELGLTYELHELSVYAGTVELLAGDATLAELELRSAKDGFARLGVESGAAQAAALLARALLDQGREEEAEAETRFAELRGGEDLKTAIAWRGARAEALARRGEHDAALALARRAVELGEPTDALADKADAYMALAAVLRGAGRDADARGAAVGARDLYAAKDHAVGRARAEEAAGLAPAPPAVSPALATLAARGHDPAGEALLAEWARLATAADYDGLRALYAEDDYVLDDRRHMANHGLQYGVEAGIESVRSVNRMALDVEWAMQPGPGRCEDGVRVVSGLCRVSGRIAETDGTFEGDYGIVVLVRDGRMHHAIVTDADHAALLAAYDELCERELGPASTGPTTVERTHAAAIAWLNEERWDDLRGLYVDEMSVTDLRAVGMPPARGADAVLAMLRDIRQYLPDVRWSDRVIAVAADLVAVSRTELTGHSADGGDVAMVLWQLLLVDPDGRLRRAELFDSEEEALARLRVVAAWCKGVADAGQRLSRRDWGAVDGRYSSQLRFVDHRQGLRDASEGIAGFWNAVFQQTSDLHVAVTVLDARTGRLCAVRMHVDGTTIHGGRFEQVANEVIVVDASGIVSAIEMFDPGDPALETRLDELEREALASEGRAAG